MRYLAQIWDGDTRVSEVEGLSLDAAREIAASGPALGFTGRLMGLTSDYCEVYPPGEEPRRGRFAEVTYVLVRN